MENGFTIEIRGLNGYGEKFAYFYNAQRRVWVKNVNDATRYKSHAIARGILTRMRRRNYNLNSNFIVHTTIAKLQES